jgi:hypothetical protein
VFWQVVGRSVGHYPVVVVKEERWEYNGSWHDLDTSWQTALTEVKGREKLICDDMYDRSVVEAVSAQCFLDQLRNGIIW